MPSLPPLDIKTNTNYAPHVVILGAGASLAAFPNGDSAGRLLPLMRNLIEIVGLEPLLAREGIAGPIHDFESFYDELASVPENGALLREMESAIREYFLELQIQNHVTLYDKLLLSLREKDLIATFNWDPFLAQAYRRNIQIKKLPYIVFLHGNVEIGVCVEHRKKGFIFHRCSECGEWLTPSTLLYPVKHKNYNADQFISNEWEILRWHLKRAYLVTIFGYSAPVTDTEARELMINEWRANPTVELAQIDIVDIRPRADLETAWRDFFVRQHFGIYANALDTYLFRHPRRTCDAFAMATLQQAPWRENPLLDTPDLAELQRWLAPLLEEEESGTLSGKPC